MMLNDLPPVSKLKIKKRTLGQNGPENSAEQRVKKPVEIFFGLSRITAMKLPLRRTLILFVLHCARKTKQYLTALLSCRCTIQMLSKRGGLIYATNQINRYSVI
jgi:hypothetical protein